jgi:hypothetical protein
MTVRTGKTGARRTAVGAGVAFSTVLTAGGTPWASVVVDMAV